MTIENNKEEMVSFSLEGLDAKGIWKELWGKELNSKKNILGYIDTIKALKQEGITTAQIEDTYILIYNSIEDMTDIVKPNTIMYLKNTLKAQLGKYVKEKDPKSINYFIEFFKEAYPPNNRRKDFTWVLMDINSITEEQIWHTLTHINTLCMKRNRRLRKEEREDIVKMVEILIKSGNIKYINQLKSMEILLKNLKIRIIGVGKWVEIKPL